MPRKKWSADSVTRALMNPLYCLSEPPAIADDQWIAANVKLIDRMGAEAYLGTLLSVLRNQEAPSPH